MFDLFTYLTYIQTNGHLFLSFILSMFIIGLTVYKTITRETNIEPFFKRVVRAVRRVARSAVKSVTKSVDPSKFVKDAVNKVGNFFKSLFRNAMRPFNSLFRSMTSDLRKMNNRLKALPNSMNRVLGKVVKDLQKSLNSMKKMILAPMAGIDTMIKNFERIMCFFETVPQRVNNVIAGVDNIFTGIEEQYNLLLKAAAAGISATNKLINFSAIFVFDYLKCAIKLITNLNECFFYYFIDALIRFLLLPIKIVIYVLSIFISIDASSVEKSIWEGIEFIDSIFFSIMQFHIIYFPSNIRKKCYTCITLKPDVVKSKAKNVQTTFKEEIPEILDGEKKNIGVAKIKRGRRQFDEASAMPRARPPSRVK